MKLMHVDCSPKQETSNSRSLSRFFSEELQKRIVGMTIDYLDLAIKAPPHVSAAFAKATYTPAAERTPEMNETLAESDALCARLLAADALLFAMPMYNWSMPSSFKAFVDAIVRTNLTYVMTPEGAYEGQLGGKNVLFITTRGADLSPGSPFASMDALTPSLRAAFGFIGVSDPRFVDAQPVQFADLEARDAALEKAKGELIGIAEEWAARWATIHSS